MRKNFLTCLSFLIAFVITFFAIFGLYATMQQRIAGEQSFMIAAKPWHIEGNKSLFLKSTAFPAHVFTDKDILEITFDVHGLCLLGNAASEVIFVDTKGITHAVSLTKFVNNCYRGNQTSTIPMTAFSHFSNGLRFDQFEVSFWYPTTYTIDINQVFVYNAVFGGNQGEHTSMSNDSTHPFLISPLAQTQDIQEESSTLSTTSTRIPEMVLGDQTLSQSTPSAVFYPSWQIQSVSSMKVTKDTICDQKSQNFIEHWVDTAKELGVNYISVETPYDSPPCGNAVAYTKLWISVIRSRGLHVWHRSTFTIFEGIYGAKKDTSKNYLQLISDYITSNPDEYQEGDIFTPIPEPQNGGIDGVTYCSQDTCMFNSAKDFNQWLRDAIDISDNAFATIGLQGKVTVGYYGFDGFIAWGDNNPQWDGILEKATVKKMGNITIDHYPEVVGETMADGLKQLEKKFPHTPIVIGEWGTITNNDPLQQVYTTMSAAKIKNVVGFNYWQMGMGGNEALINDDFSHKPTFAAVQSFYKSPKP